MGQLARSQKLVGVSETKAGGGQRTPVFLKERVGANSGSSNRDVRTLARALGDGDEVRKNQFKSVCMNYVTRILNLPLEERSDRIFSSIELILFSTELSLALSSDTV